MNKLQNNIVRIGRRNDWNRGQCLRAQTRDPSLYTDHKFDSELKQNVETQTQNAILKMV